jgi:hypothetical protein
MMLFIGMFLCFGPLQPAARENVPPHAVGDERPPASEDVL